MLCDNVKYCKDGYGLDKSTLFLRKKAYACSCWVAVLCVCTARPLEVGDGTSSVFQANRDPDTVIDEAQVEQDAQVSAAEWAVAEP